MSLTTIAINGLDYVSYSTVAEANYQLDVDPTRHDSWEANTTVQKEEDLVTATMRLDVLDWRGEKAGGPTQRNAWPRTGMTYSDGTPIPDDIVPYDVERATALLAGSITMNPSYANHGNSTVTGTIQSVRAGSVQITYAGGGATVTQTETVPLQDETAWQLVEQWVVGGGGAYSFGATTFAFGTGGKSTFRPSYYSDLLRGY